MPPQASAKLIYNAAQDSLNLLSILVSITCAFGVYRHALADFFFYSPCLLIYFLYSTLHIFTSLIYTVDKCV